LLKYVFEALLTCLANSNADIIVGIAIRAKALSIKLIAKSNFIIEATTIETTKR